MKFYNLFLLLFLHFACSPKMDFQNIDLNIPNHWETVIQNSDSITGLWWEMFNDTILVKYIQEIHNKNNTLKNITSQQNIALYNSYIQKGSVYPNLNLLSNSNQSVQNLANFGFSNSFLSSNNDTNTSEANNTVISFHSDSYNLQLGIQWELDIWGRALNGYKASYSDYKSIEYDLSYLRFSLLVQSVKVYFQAIEAYKQLEIAKKSYNSLLEIRNLVKDRYENGLRPSLDYRMAETALSTAKAQIELRKINSNQMNRLVHTLQGKYPSNIYSLSYQLPNKMPSVPKGIPADILKRRPDIQSEIKKIEAENFRLKQSKRNLLPGIMLNGSAGTSTNELKNIFEKENGIWSLGLSISQPLFNQGKLKSAIKAQHAIKENAIINLKIKLLDAFSEIEQLLELELSLKNQLNALSQANTQSKEAYLLAQERYEKGITSLELVLNSQKQFNDIQSQHLSIKKEQLNNRLNLILALGGNIKNKEMEHK